MLVRVTNKHQTDGLLLNYFFLGFVFSHVRSCVFTFKGQIQPCVQSSCRGHRKKEKRNELGMTEQPHLQVSFIVALAEEPSTGNV